MNKEPSPAQKAIGDISPKLAQLTDDMLFGDVWERPELSKRDRSLVTVTALIVGGNTDQLPFHLKRARENGVTECDVEVIPMQQVNEAYERLLKGDVKYRFSIDMASLSKD